MTNNARENTPSTATVYLVKSVANLGSSTKIEKILGHATGDEEMIKRFFRLTHKTDSEIQLIPTNVIHVTTALVQQAKDLQRQELEAESRLRQLGGAE
jgi:hypothetical protein